jgi:AraC family transcriptional regulator, transcriptional activator of pobA
MTYISKITDDLEREIKHFCENDKHMLRAILYQTLIWLQRKYMIQHPNALTATSNRHIQAFFALVEKHVHEQHSVAYYADKLNITPGHLNDLCQYEITMGAKQYILKMLVAEAKKLLLFSELSVSEIADKLNFQDPSYFTRIFKKATGKTPQLYSTSNIP